MLLGPNRFGDPATPALSGMGKVRSNPRRWQEFLEDLCPSRAGAPPDPGIQAAYPCRGRERIEDLRPSRPGPPPDLGIQERPRYEIERKRER